MQTYVQFLEIVKDCKDGIFIKYFFLTVVFFSLYECTNNECTKRYTR